MLLLMLFSLWLVIKWITKIRMIVILTSLQNESHVKVKCKLCAYQVTNVSKSQYY